jgi:hypothetical protein
MAFYPILTKDFVDFMTIHLLSKIYFFTLNFDLLFYADKDLATLQLNSFQKSGLW